jgi:hypothetical protein
MISSVIPSLKYSFSGSELRFRNGRIAIDLLSIKNKVGVSVLPVIHLYRKKI